MPRQRKARATPTADTTTEAAPAVETVVDEASVETPPEVASAVPDPVQAGPLDGASEREEEPTELADTPDAPPRDALPALIEALLFVSEGPVEARTLARGLGAGTRAVTAALDELSARLEGRGVMLQTGADGVQLVTVPQAAPYIQTFLGLEQNRRLSNAALEALAIIAYRQPVTRATIEAVRGVSSDGAIQTLRARGLIEEAGRAQGPGRPTLFVTTRRFLEHFGLQGAQDLPPLGDYELPPHDTSMPMDLPTGLEAQAPSLSTPEDGVETAGAIEEVSEALASLSQAARSLADPAQRRPGATALLLPGTRPLGLPSPSGLPSSPGFAPPGGGSAQLPRS